MTQGQRTGSGEAATRVILAGFRAHGLLLAAGDRLASKIGLTASRWQVLGAIALAGRPLTVPQIARRMGLQRQSVHVTVSGLVREGLLARAENADHRRSALVDLTERGRSKYTVVDAHQAVWVNELAAGIPRASLETAARVLAELGRRLEAGEGAATRKS